VHDGECSLSNGPPVARSLQQGPVRGITRRRQRRSERPLTGQQRALAFYHSNWPNRGRKQKFKLRHYPAPRPLHRSGLGLTASRLRRHGGQGGGSG